MSTFFSKYDLIRKHFGKFTAKTAVSLLAAFYKKSYDEFLQLHKQPHEREEYGLESLLRRIFPIECRKLTQDREDLPNTHQREIYFYSHYVVSTPILTEEECRMKGGSYFGTIHIVTFKVTLRDDRPLNHDVSIDKVDYLQKHTFTLPLRGIPLMTEQGTFLVNGIERAILAQLQRCPGTYASKRDDYVSLKVIPYYGSNIQFEIGKAGKIFVRLMGKRRIPLYLFLSSLGISSQEIISLFFNPCLVRKNAAVEVLKSSTHQANLRIAYDIKRFQFGFATRNIYDARTGKLRIREGEEINKDLFVKILSSSLLNHTLTKEMMNSLSYFETPVLSNVKSLEESEASIQGVGHFLSLAGVRVQNSSLLEERQVYISTKSSPRSKYAFYYSPESASWKKRIIESVHEYQAQDSLTSFSRMIHLMRGNKSANYLCTERERDELIRRMMLDPVHFNLSHFGRAQMNDALQLPSNMYHGILTKIDIYSLVLSLLKKVYHIASEDNLYQLQNRKVRLPGELLGHILLKSFLQIKRKKDFSSKFQALPFDFKTLVYKDTLPAFVRSRMIQSFLLNLYNTKEVSSRARNKWLEYRSFIYYDSTDKLAQILLPLAKRQIEGFLTGSNLSQLLDQLNPLSELTHLRRLSLLGPDGLNKDNVSLDTRDVQSSFFGRICPIETPEGKAVGIVNSMAIFSKLDEQGDLLTPYLCVRNGYLQTEVHYLSSKKEPDHAIALLEESVNPTMELRNSLIYCKYKHQFVYLEKHLVEYIDVSPKQMLSLSSSLIPFLEHNDGNRALMGSNMQRQAVPSLVKELSFIGTGSEDCIANQELQESVLSHSLSWQDNLSLFYTFDSKKSTRLPLFEKSLVKFEKANQKSYKSESPRGIVGDTFTSSQKVLDMTGTKEGQLSIGHNMTIGFMSMNGYSFEDSIVISDRLLKDSLFSSMHTKELVVLDWEIQQSPHERITRNIPNTEEKDIRYLDEDGIVKAGSPLSGGDILVGKVFVRSRKTMKMDDKEEFLQGLLLGEKKELIRDISERAPMDIEGSVLDVKKYYTLPEQEISTRYYRKKIQMAQQAYIVRSMLLQHHFLSMFFNALDQHPKGFVSLPAFLTLQEFYQDGVRLDNAKNIAPLWKKARSLAHLVSQSSNISWTSTIIKKLFEDKNIPLELARSLKKALLSYLRLSLELRLAWYRKHILPLSKLAHSSSSLKMVKVLVAYRHKLKPGDKMTGRHGNKGVVSQVVPMQDMPYTSDGLSMDIILNPIGISSRMNLGQVFEVHLGLAAAELGKKIKKLLRLQNSDHQYIDLRNFLYHIYGDTKEQRILSKLNESQIRSLLQKILRGVPMATIPFSGASEMDVKDYLQMANLDPRGQVDIYDGKTGEKFDRKITTGTMYVLKLNHLVDDKIHSRFTGPYNRITEQPLGGKSLHGGQRFGEMEVWALQAYGAAYTLLDMTTVKSDSRMSKMTSLPMYKNQRFKQKSKRTFPEAFNVLLRELWCLGLLVRVS